jgi:hypothetical protein
MIKSTIANFLQTESKTLGSLLTRLNQLNKWNSILQECLAKEDELINHCQIVNLTGTSLIVIADSPHWITRLRFYIPQLLPKLRNYPGLEKVQAICSKVQPNYTKIKPKKRKPQQRPTTGTATIIREIANKLPDEKLKLILEKIASQSE